MVFTPTKKYFKVLVIQRVLYIQSKSMKFFFLFTIIELIRDRVICYANEWQNQTQIYGWASGFFFDNNFRICLAFSQNLHAIRKFLCGLKHSPKYPTLYKKKKTVNTRILMRDKMAAYIQSTKEDEYLPFFFIVLMHQHLKLFLKNDDDEEREKKIAIAILKYYALYRKYFCVCVLFGFSYADVKDYTNKSTIKSKMRICNAC